MEMEVTLAAGKPISLMDLISRKSNKVVELMKLKDAVEIDHRIITTLAAEKDNLCVQGQPKAKEVTIEIVSWSYFYKIAKLNDPSPIYTNSRDIFSFEYPDYEIIKGDSVDDFLEKNKKFSIKEYIRITGFVKEFVLPVMPSPPSVDQDNIFEGQLISASISPYGVSVFKKRLINLLSTGSDKKLCKLSFKIGETLKNKFGYVDVLFI